MKDRHSAFCSYSAFLYVWDGTFCLPVTCSLLCLPSACLSTWPFTCPPAFLPHFVSGRTLTSVQCTLSSAELQMVFFLALGADDSSYGAPHLYLIKVKCMIDIPVIMLGNFTVGSLSLTWVVVFLSSSLVSVFKIITALTCQTGNVVLLLSY